MQKNINEDAQRKRKKNALVSAVVSTISIAFPALLLLFLRWHYEMAGTFWGTVILIISVLNLGMIIPVWILLKQRLKEIEGGEEDVAAQY